MFPPHRSTQCEQALEDGEKCGLGHESKLAWPGGGARNQCGNTRGGYTQCI